MDEKGTGSAKDEIATTILRKFLCKTAGANFGTISVN